MPKLYALAGAPEITVTPAAGAVESLQEFTLYCADGLTLNKQYFTLYNTDYSVYNSSPTCTQVDANTVKVDFGTTYTAADTYTLYIPAKTLIAGPGSFDYTEKMEFTYTIAASADAPELVVTPENGATQTSLQTFTFACEQGIALNTAYTGDAPFLGESISGTTYALTPSLATDFQMTFNTESEITTAGYYVLVIPAGYFLLGDNVESSAIQNQYTIMPAINITSVTPDPETAVESLSTITVNFDTELFDAPTTWQLLNAAGEKAADITCTLVDPFTSVTVTLAEAITTADAYTLYIPAGSVSEMEGSKTVNETSITFTVGGSASADVINFLSVDPAEGAVTSLKTIKVYTDTDLDSATGLTLTDANGTSYEIKTTVNPDGAGIYSIITVTITSEITADGTYTLTIPAGAVNEYGNASKVNEAKTYTWNIGGTTAEGINFLSVDPAEGTVSSLKTIKVNTDTGLDTSVTGVTLTDANGADYAVSCTTNDWDNSGKYTYLTVTIASEITAEGTYTLTIPAGAVNEYGNTSKVNEAKTYTWTIGGTAEEGLYVTATYPAEGANVESFSEMLVSWSMDIDESSSEKCALLNESGETVCELSVSWSNVESYQVRLKVPTATGAITADGVYYVYIPAGKFTDFNTYKKESKEAKIKIIVGSYNGINGVKADPTYGYRVYNFSGILVKQTQDASELKSLENGLYIINGKKVFLNNK